MRLFEISDTNSVTLWHGGRNLEMSYRELRGNNSSQMEYGPGLYLTNYYETAAKYAKGGGKTYLVEFSRGTNIDDVTLDITTVITFIKTTRLKNKNKLMAFINEKFTNQMAAIKLLNLLVNFDSLTPGSSGDVRQFLVNNGVDYHVSHGFGGYGDQIIVVIFNPSIIKSVTPVASSDVSPAMHHLEVKL